MVGKKRAGERERRFILHAPNIYESDKKRRNW
jgi:hypothetical protein